MMNLNDAVFFLLAAMTVFSALGVIISKNIVHSALLLVVTFLGVAGIYLQMNAGFIGLVQILIYGGAISVLIIFAIMLVMDVEVKKTNLPGSTPRRLAGAYVSILLTAALGASIWFTSWHLAGGVARGDEMATLADLMLGMYVVPFEVAAIMLLVAVVGAIILAKGADEK